LVIILSITISPIFLGEVSPDLRKLLLNSITPYLNIRAICWFFINISSTRNSEHGAELEEIMVKMSSKREIKKEKFFFI